MNSNSNNNNMYINNNPTLRGYEPRNGNHFNRSRMLSKPGSFVPGHMANDVNEYERRMPLPFDRGGDDSGGENRGIRRWNRRNERWQMKGRNVGSRYDGNNNYNHDYGGYNQHNQHSQSYSYGSRQRSYNNSRYARFDPIQNSHNQYLDYGLERHN